ncbi:PDZ domain-containing protein, partial [bacterium]|nr:PDZ domain-containing protein [bacterium]
ATVEADEVVSAQLDLEPGVGLVVTFVSPDSPAAKAGLKKNDLLVELNGNALVHPSQFRKLIGVRKPGDEITLAYFRGGKKQNVKVELAKNEGAPDMRPFKEEFRRQLGTMHRQLQELPFQDAWQDKMKSLTEAMKDLKIDQEKLQKELQRSFRDARNAMQEALRARDEAAEVHADVLKELESSDVELKSNATVVVRSSGGSSVRSLVRTDDFGTIALVASPKPHLTAHAKNGDLLFEGEIATPEQQAKVPKDLWERVKPLLEDLTDRQKF